MMFEYIGDKEEIEHGNAVIGAARNGHLEKLTELLAYSKYTISPEDLGRAVEEASKNGHLKALKELFAYSKGTISPFYLGQAIIEASRNGHLKVIRKLLPYFKAIINSDDYYLRHTAETTLKEAVKEAVKEAAKNGHLKALEKLYAYAKGIISSYCLQRAVVAAGNRHLKVIRKLLTYDISPEHLGQAVIDIARNNYLEALKELLAYSKGIISPEHLGQAVIETAKNGHLEALEELLAYSKDIISLEHLGKAVIEAAKYGHLKALEELFAHSKDTIDSDYLGVAVIEVAKNGRLKALKEVLAYSKGTISPNDLNFAFRMAKMKGHQNIVEMLIAIDAPTDEKITPQEKLTIMLKNTREQTNYMKSVTFPVSFPIKNEAWKKTIAIIELIANTPEKLDTEVLGKINYALMRLVTDDLKILAVFNYFSKTEYMDQFTHINSGPLAIIGEYLYSDLNKLEGRFNELKQLCSDLQEIGLPIDTAAISTDDKSNAISIPDSMTSSNVTIITMPPPTQSASAASILTGTQPINRSSGERSPHTHNLQP